MKNTKRKGFNFFRSYYDVYNELSDKDKVQFMDALLDKQFLGKEPEDLKGMAKFAYISQMNSINTQVKGFEDKTGIVLNSEATKGGCEDPTEGGYQGGCQGGFSTPTLQVEEKGKVEVEEKGKNKSTPLGVYSEFFETDKYLELWKEFISLKKRKKASVTDRALRSQLKKLTSMSRDSEDIYLILENSVNKGWLDFYPLKENKTASKVDHFINVAQEAIELQRQKRNE